MMGPNSNAAISQLNLITMNSNSLRGASMLCPLSLPILNESEKEWFKTLASTTHPFNSTSKLSLH
jgi:hypothetical protein